MNPPDERRTKQRDPQDEKKARLAEKLRANLQRRKAQARSRRAGEADSRPEGLMSGPPQEDGDGQERGD